MTCANDFCKYAAAQWLASKEALKKGVKEKNRELVDKAAEFYAKAS